MSSSQHAGQPKVLSCPHCGAPLQAAPYALTARCAYCGHDVQLGRSAPPPPAYAPAPRAPAPVPPTARLAPALIAFAIAGLVAVGFIALTVVRLASSATPTSAPAPLERSAPAPANETARSQAAATPAPASPRVAYPLRSLLSINTAVDIDGSRAHLQALFPTIASAPSSNELGFTLPLRHPWFSEVTLHWKNEQNGKLVSVGMNPPQGDDRLKNQKEIADCLAKTLGKPTVQDVNHLEGEVNYFFGSRFPKASLSVYRSYVWLLFEDPKGAPPVTFANMIRTLDGCMPTP